MGGAGGGPDRLDTLPPGSETEDRPRACSYADRRPRRRRAAPRSRRAPSPHRRRSRHAHARAGVDRERTGQRERRAGPPRGTRTALGDVVTVVLPSGTAASRAPMAAERRHARRSVRRRPSPRARQAGGRRRAPHARTRIRYGVERAPVARARLAGRAASLAGRPARQADVGNPADREDGGRPRGAAADADREGLSRRGVRARERGERTNRSAAGTRSRRPAEGRRVGETWARRASRDSSGSRAWPPRARACRCSDPGSSPAAPTRSASTSRRAGGRSSAIRSTASRGGRTSPTRALAAALRAFPRQALHAWRMALIHPVTRARWLSKRPCRATSKTC